MMAGKREKPIINNNMASFRIVLVPVFMLAAMLVFTACRGIREAHVVIAGSTSVQPYIELLAEEFISIRPDIDVDVQGGGSSAGITAADTGTADIGMSSRALKDSETGYWVIEIAKDGLAVIVNASNPVTDLSLEQVRAVYTNEITDWGELGGADAKIHVITREEGSGTRGAFEELVMDGSYITPRAIVQDSNGAVRQLVTGDPNAIGFISLGLVNDAVKAINLDGVVASKKCSERQLQPFQAIFIHY